jgi:hypothetical protein
LGELVERDYLLGQQIVQVVGRGAQAVDQQFERGLLAADELEAGACRRGAVLLTAVRLGFLETAGCAVVKGPSKVSSLWETSPNLGFISPQTHAAFLPHLVWTDEIGAQRSSTMPDGMRCLCESAKGGWIVT